MFLPLTAFVLFETGSKHEELEREVTVLSGPILQALAHKVGFVPDDHPSFEAQILRQSASCLNLWSRSIFLYLMLGMKCYNVINHVLTVLMDDLIHICTFLSVSLSVTVV